MEDDRAWLESTNVRAREQVLVAAALTVAADGNACRSSSRAPRVDGLLGGSGAKPGVACARAVLEPVT